MTEHTDGADNVEPTTSPTQPAVSDSVVTGLDGITWTEEHGVSYDVALEGINQVIGAYSGLIGDEQDSEHLDPDAIAGWRREKPAWAGRRRELTPAAPDQVAAVRRECATLLRDLPGRP